MKQVKKQAKKNKKPSCFSKLTTLQKILSIALSFVLVMSLCLGITLIIKSCNTCVKYNGITISKDVFCYFQASFKYNYLSKYASSGAKDTDAFWNSEKDTETHLTWKEDFDKECNTYIGRVLAASTLFDEAGYTLSDTYYSNIENIVSSILENRFENSTKVFNQKAKVYGFTYKSMKKALLFEMKATLLLSYAETTDETALATYFKDSYIRIGIVYIPKSAASYDDTISFLDGALEAGTTQTEFISWMNDTSLNKNPGYSSYSSGYYFSIESEYTNNFAINLPTVVSAAFSLELGESLKVSIQNENLGLDGTYYLMRLDLEEAPYSEDTDTAKDMFSDFQSNANSYYATLWLDDCISNVKFYSKNMPIIEPQGKTTELYLFFQ